MLCHLQAEQTTPPKSQPCPTSINCSTPGCHCPASIKVQFKSFDSWSPFQTLPLCPGRIHPQVAVGVVLLHGEGKAVVVGRLSSTSPGSQPNPTLCKIRLETLSRIYALQTLPWQPSILHNLQRYMAATMLRPTVGSKAKLLPLWYQVNSSLPIRF